MIYKEQFKLTPEDIRSNMLITNKAILTIFENIATHQSDDVGYGAADIPMRGLAWLLLEWKIRVKKRISYREKIMAATWPRTLDRFYSFRDFEMYNGDGELCVIGTSKWLLYDINRKKISRITQEVQDAYCMDTKEVFAGEALERIREPEKYDSVFEYRTMRHDIDLNGHVHNLNYLDLAYEALPEEVYNDEEFNEFRISYKKEIKPGESIRCKYANVDGRHVVGIYGADDETVHALIEMI